MMRLRCACRPGCLAWLSRDDVTVETPDGLTLVAHLAVHPYPEALLDDEIVVAS